jgi:hypothetical protein
MPIFTLNKLLAPPKPFFNPCQTLPPIRSRRSRNRERCGGGVKRHSQPIRADPTLIRLGRDNYRFTYTLWFKCCSSLMRDWQLPGEYSMIAPIQVSVPMFTIDNTFGFGVLRRRMRIQNTHRSRNHSAPRYANSSSACIGAPLDSSKPYPNKPVQTLAEPRKQRSEDINHNLCCFHITPRPDQQIQPFLDFMEAVLRPHDVCNKVKILYFMLPSRKRVKLQAND